jgi:MATE family multidrug resistance protein
VVAQWVGFAVFLLFVRKSLPKERDSFVSKGGYAFFFSVNRDIFLRTLCLLSVNFYFTSAGAAQGAMILAVNALLMQLFLLFSYFLDGFAYSGEALAGKYCGAASWQQLQSVVRNLFGWGLLMVVVFTLVYAVGGSTFLRLLTSDAEVVAAAQPFYVWTLLIPVCGVAAFVWDGVFVGITHTHGMLWACFLAALVFFAVWFALKGSWGNHALWLALNLFLLTRGLVQTIVFSRWMRSVSH